MKKSLLLLIALSMLAFTGCATTVAQNASDYVVNLNLDTSDFELGAQVNESGKYSTEQINNGTARSLLMAKALKDSGYDLILLPRLEVTSAVGGNTVTLHGRLAKLK